MIIFVLECFECLGDFMSLLQKVMEFKEHPSPELRITKLLTVKYLMIAFSGRYIVANLQDEQISVYSENIVKTSNLDVAKTLVQALADKYGNVSPEDMDKFWNDVESYEKFLNARSEKYDE